MGVKDEFFKHGSFVALSSVMGQEHIFGRMCGLVTAH
jgi:hypothetical protein